MLQTFFFFRILTALFSMCFSIFLFLARYPSFVSSSLALESCLGFQLLFLQFGFQFNLLDNWWANHLFRKSFWLVIKIIAPFVIMHSPIHMLMQHFHCLVYVSAFFNFHSFMNICLLLVEGDKQQKTQYFINSNLKSHNCTVTRNLSFIVPSTYTILTHSIVVHTEYHIKVKRFILYFF